MNREDRRTRRTQKALRESLAALMLEKELGRISVRELADAADVHRATFYAHYKDIYDLYEQLENAVLEEFSELIRQTPSSYEKLFEAIVDYVQDHTKICRMLLRPHAPGHFHDRFSRLLEESYLTDWLAETGETEITEEWRFFAHYHIQGCLAIVNRWADRHYVDPKGRIMDLFLRASRNFDELMP